MRIGFDFRTATRQKTGDRTYTVNLARELLRLLTPEELWLLTDEAKAQVEGPPPHWPRHEVAALIPGLWTPLHLPVFARRHQLDLLHVQYIVPPLSPCPVLTTIHDLSFEVLPQTFPFRHRFMLQRLIPWAVAQAARVLTGSESTKQDLVRLYRVSPHKIVVTPYGVDESLFARQASSTGRTLEQRNLLPGYFLFVGVAQPRKNLPTLLRAYARLDPDLRSSHPLVLAGKEGWMTEPIERALAEGGIAQQVRRLGYVPDGDLPVLYRNALAFVFPSLYEGFGLPILEAMACGAPVITSNVSSMPEVAGDATLLVDPHSVNELAAAMRHLAEDVELRRNLSARGREQARLFRWEHTARLTLQVYREMMPQ